MPVGKITRPKIGPQEIRTSATQMEKFGHGIMLNMCLKYHEVIRSFLRNGQQRLSR